MKIVIIGNGIAAEKALSELFKMEGQDEITLIKGEKYGPYPRPRLPEYIKGGLSEDVFKSDKLSKYVEKGLSVLSSLAIEIDVKGKSVLLENGDAVPYDSLILTMGSRARRLDIPNAGVDVFSLRSILDAEKIIGKLEGRKFPVVVGGGLLGLELATALATRTGLRVSVIEGAAHLLPRQLDENASLFFEHLLLEKGIDVVKGSSPVSYEKNGVLLADGRKVTADIIFESVGVVAEKEIAEKAGIKVERAVLIDSHARTSEKDIYAAGDVSSFNGFFSGLVSYAMESARVAAINARGGDTEMNLSSPSASLDAGGIVAYSIGEVHASNPIRTNERENRYEALYTDEEGLLVGAIAIGSRANMMKVIQGLGKPVDLSILDF